ncbi:MAG: hypothetical protein HYY40_02960 [Bacteroidetes bacterium]|nr:hypothetical protein [Bacteroidota bacterium]
MKNPNEQSIISVKKISIVCYYYCFELSPVLKNICTFFYDKFHLKIDVFVENIYRDKLVKVKGANIFSLSDHYPLRSFFYKNILQLSQINSFKYFIKNKIRRYDLIFAVDFLSLLCLYDVGFDLKKVVFLSFEGIDFMKISTLKKSHIYALLESCKMRIIQNKERAEDVSNYLEKNLVFNFLPVSQRQEKVISRKGLQNRIQIIYSGYFAEWSGLREFLYGYKLSGSFNMCDLVLQGHSIATEKYLAELHEIILSISGCTIDECFYSDAEHLNLLADKHVGLAFYNNIGNSSNFENLITSSGKIASYLKSGLAILTNINEDITKKPPFIYIENYSPEYIRIALETINANREQYAQAAFDLVSRLYDFDRYISSILVQLGFKINT